MSAAFTMGRSTAPSRSWRRRARRGLASQTRRRRSARRDRPGLAAEIGRVLRAENLFIRMAKLVTVGERAEDVFYVTDSAGQPLSKQLEDRLRSALLQAIDKHERREETSPTEPLWTH